MPQRSTRQFDWSGRMESLEERLPMSADPLGGLLGGAIGHHATIDEPPALDHHLIEEPPALDHHLVEEPPALDHHLVEEPPALDHHLTEEPPALDQHVEPTPDFWIDYDNISRIEDDLREIEKTLEEAHDQQGLDNIIADYGFTGIGQTVAIIDSGIAYDHFALGGGFGSNYRVVGGWDFTTENDADPYDDGPEGSHGTHVAGIVGGESAVDHGVASGVDFVALRVFDDAGAGYFNWVENALDWVHDNRNAFENPITAINLSLGVATWNSDTIPAWANLEDEFAQLKADGIFISVSAGNSFATYGTPGLSYPAASQHVVPVMSVDNDGDLSYYSQRHSRAIAAPGRSITSTVPDYDGNNNGVADDYGTKSGTSMAAPYVAGASVLIREAMEFAGYTNITQDTIFDHMVATADSFFDSATNAWYDRLNLEAAIDALMPADDYGSTIATAFSLGTVSNPMAMSGTVGTLNDIDYFSFTAANTGTVTFTASNMTHELGASWDVDGATGTWSGAQNEIFTIDVVAGQTCTVGFLTDDGLGYYDLDITAESTFSFTDWGTVSFNELTGLSVTDGSWYRVEAGAAGYLTVEALFDAGGSQISLEFYDDAMQLIDTGSAANGESRVDVYAAAGQEMYVKVVGTNSDVDFRLTNLVSVSGTTVNVGGVAGNDVYSLSGGTTHVVTVNDVAYQFASTAITDLHFAGGNGTDSIAVSNAGSLGLTVEGIEQVVDLDATAYALDNDLDLQQGANDYVDWGGWGERWMASGSGEWYFVTPTGDFYHWVGGSDLSLSTLVATLDAQFHADLALLTDTTATSFTQSLETASVDYQFGLYSNGNYTEDWGGWGEKWMRSAGGDWYFITPDGDLYRWTGGSDLAQSQQVASLATSHHTTPALLHDAADFGSPHSDLAFSLDQQLGLYGTSSYSENWGGSNEKWIKGSGGQWYYITPTGGLYQWSGERDLTGSTLVAVLNSRFHEDPSLLHANSAPSSLALEVESASHDEVFNVVDWQITNRVSARPNGLFATKTIGVEQSPADGAQRQVIDSVFGDIDRRDRFTAYSRLAEDVADHELDDELDFLAAFDSALADLTDTVG